MPTAPRRSPNGHCRRRNTSFGASNRWPFFWKIASHVLSAELNALQAALLSGVRLQLDVVSVPARGDPLCVVGAEDCPPPSRPPRPPMPPNTAIRISTTTIPPHPKRLPIIGNSPISRPPPPPPKPPPPPDPDPRWSSTLMFGS
ncbi:hypothetical protein QFZ54_000641 [Sphingomonas faeni]|nr:hypothetical protein [Sphingomonas faeni]